MQPDIEIYLKDVGPEAVHAWLTTVFSHCSDWHGTGKLLRCDCDGIKVTWYHKAVGSWHSLFFASANTPWANDLACAQAAFAALAVQIRCAPNSWQETDGEADADRWLKISDLGTQEFIWRS